MARDVLSADRAKGRRIGLRQPRADAIEINATFYRRQSPATFAKWRDETPDGFRFTVKAHRYAVTRKTADEMQAAIANFLDSGVTQLGDKLGAVNRQFPATRTFDAAYFSAFLEALPPEHAGLPLAHAIEVRHPSFAAPGFVDLLRAHACALVCADSEAWPVADVETAPFAYARLQRSQGGIKTGYPPRALTTWAKTFKSWAARRAVYAFVISGAKETNPAAAQALIQRVAASKH